MVVPCSAHKIIDIVHDFEFISIVSLIMDGNLPVIAFILPILMVIVLVCIKNVVVYDIDINFKTYNVTSYYTSLTTVKTRGIDTIALEFAGIDSKVTGLSDV